MQSQYITYAWFVCAYLTIGCVATAAVGEYYRCASGTYRVRWRFMLLWPLLMLLMCIYIIVALLDALLGSRSN